jgi:hypothetical protein
MWTDLVFDLKRKTELKEDDELVRGPIRPEDAVFSLAR